MRKRSTETTYRSFFTRSPIISSLAVGKTRMIRRLFWEPEKFRGAKFISKNTEFSRNHPLMLGHVVYITIPSFPPLISANLVDMNFRYLGDLLDMDTFIQAMKDEGLAYIRPDEYINDQTAQKLKYMPPRFRLCLLNVMSLEFYFENIKVTDHFARFQTEQKRQKDAHPFFWALRQIKPYASASRLRGVGTLFSEDNYSVDKIRQVGVHFSVEQEKEIPEELAHWEIPDPFSIRFVPAGLRMDILNSTYQDPPQLNEEE